MSEAVAMRVHKITRIICGSIAVLVFLSDQWTKAMVEASIPEHTSIPVVPHFLNLTHVYNAGAAFGLFSDSPSPFRTGVLISVSAALLVAVVGVVWKTRRLRWEAGVGLALILGGATSNLFDRVRLGRVVDFLDVYYRSYHWPAFNVADSAIVIGAFFLILEVITAD